MDKKEELLQQARQVEKEMTDFCNKIYKETNEYIITKGDNPKDKTLDNLRNAEEWANIALQKFQLCIANLKNKKGYPEKRK